MSRVGSAVRMVISPPSPAARARIASCAQRSVKAVTPARRAASQPLSTRSRRRAPNSRADACSTRAMSSSRSSKCSGSATQSCASGAVP